MGPEWAADLRAGRGDQLLGGDHREWLKNQLELIRDASEVEMLAKSVSDNGGVYLVPAFSGLSAPHWNAEARAAIIGMSSHSTKAHIVRAALESVAYQLCDVLQMVRADYGIVLHRINVDGGASQNDFLMQFTADITRVELHRRQAAESSALGAALCGALGCGWYASLDEITALDEIAARAADYDRVLPTMEEETAQHNLHGWRQAIGRVLWKAEDDPPSKGSPPPPHSHTGARRLSEN